MAGEEDDWSRVVGVPEPEVLIPRPVAETSRSSGLARRSSGFGVMGRDFSTGSRDVMWSAGCGGGSFVEMDFMADETMLALRSEVISEVSFIAV